MTASGTGVLVVLEAYSFSVLLGSDNAHVTFVWFVVGALVGAVIVWLATRARVREADARLEAEQKAGGEKLAIAEQARSTLEETFKALSADVLRDSTASLLTLAEGKVEPLKAALDKMDKTVRELEQARHTEAGSLRTQLEALGKETQSLSRALRTPDTVGNWGQIQLRRVVELAGMLDHCDFDEQTSVTTDDGHRQRPDVVVHLPGDAHVVVDAKVPRRAYLEAERVEDKAQRREHLKRHAQLVRQHMTQLGSKRYWERFPTAPECVVMFVPHEPFISEACREDSQLIEDGFANDKVMIATPLTLIALLYGFAAGWRQVKTEEHAQEVARHGRELYKRLGTLGEHFRDLGSCLTKAVAAYNCAVGSLESRVLPAARQFPRLLATGDAEHAVIERIDQQPRDLQAAELTQAPLHDVSDSALPERAQA
jgi:DNA recombination protein RmuC